LEGAEPTDRDAILLIGVAGLRPEDAFHLARHLDPDYRGISNWIKRARKSRNVIASRKVSL
jgi:hypothetical protein